MIPLLKKINKALFIILVLNIHPVGAQHIGELFLKMPDKLLPVLTQQQRFELLEYAKINRKDSVKNAFNGYATVIAYDSLKQYIALKPTKISITELRVFQANNQDYILGLIQTVLQPIPSSTIALYNTNWQPISNRVAVPQATNWLSATSLSPDSLSNMKKILANSFTSLTFSGNAHITATNHSLSFLSREDKQAVEPFVVTNNLLYNFADNIWHFSQNP